MSKQAATIKMLEALFGHRENLPLYPEGKGAWRYVVDGVEMSGEDMYYLAIGLYGGYFVTDSKAVMVLRRNGHGVKILN